MQDASAVDPALEEHPPNTAIEHVVVATDGRAAEHRLLVEFVEAAWFAPDRA